MNSRERVMSLPLLSNPAFLEDFARMSEVRLNPERHLAPDARAHSLDVAERAMALAGRNHLGDAAARRLGTLGLVHDIGKITGDRRPERSVTQLERYGLTEPGFVALVRHHDVALPWWKAQARGQPPSDAAWRRLAAQADLRALALFAVADRVDAPGGWANNRPTAWFVAEVQRRRLAPALDIDPGPDNVVRGAGAVVLSEGHVLVVPRGPRVELPKGKLEPGESALDAARRELVEETGVVAPEVPEADLGALTHTVKTDILTYEKVVRYFAFRLPRRPEPRRGARWLPVHPTPGFISPDLARLVDAADQAPPAPGISTPSVGSRVR
ncbi:MAG: NUDIX domain-containing protein [Deltaproteobacteria bacterium]|nr:NUDIX domain-containing protein [Deltaproteobacteria bacterium]